MIDTILINLEIDDFQGEWEDYNNFNILISKIETLKNCKIKRKDDDKISVILSFPKFYSDTNAYLLTKISECKKVNRNFINSILTGDRNFVEWLKQKIKINLIRVDVPITYFMNENTKFSDYTNIFSLLEKTYTNKNLKIGSNDEIESFILYNGKTKDSSNIKITIYNQYKKFQNMLPKTISNLERKFPDLKLRMRIEITKRVRRKAFTLIEFKHFDFFENYITNYIQNIKDTLFNEDRIKVVWNMQIDYLTDKFYNSSVNLDKFIFMNIKDIWDYDIMREVLRRVIENDNTYYKKCAKVKEILKEREYETGVIYFNILDILKDMKKSCKVNRGGR